MSLHHLANHLQTAGRGEDKVLVHMTPKEVSGLQQLAMAHGGSLTINPKTGLAEAGFLSAILPMIAGLALGPAGIGLTAMQAGLAVGAVGTLATGSLGKGIMAGLGAYGGAGMGAGLVSAGTPAATGTTSTLAGTSPMGTLTGAGVENFAAPTAFKAAQTAQTAVQTGALPTLGGYNASSIMPNLANQGAASAISTAPIVRPPFAATPGTDVFRPQVDLGQISQSPINTLDVRSMNPPVSSSVVNAEQVAPRSVMFDGATPKAAYQAPEMTNFEKAQAGFKDVTSSGKKAWEFMKEHPMPFISTGIAAAKAMQPEYEPPEVNQGMIRPYEYTYGATGADTQPYSGSGERTYFNPQYTALKPYKAPGPEYAAQGGLMGLKYAVGGPVEQMSADNAISANQMYPQSQLQTAIYSNPMVQRPMPNDVVNPSGDAGVDPYTGEARFAEGGETTGGYRYDYDPKTQKFTQIAKPTPVNPISKMFGGLNGIGNAGMTGAPMGNGVIARAVRAAQGQTAPEAPIVTGGIAPPVGQTQQMQSYQPLQQPINVPAYQTPEQQLGLNGFYDYMNQQLSGMRGYAVGGMTDGHLGGYSDGGRLLKGPGDGVSDSIPAVIGNRQPARLADGEFVVPARIVSELGNGSTEAGAKRLYAMMERVQKARGKTTGKNKVAINSKADKYLPA